MTAIKFVSEAGLQRLSTKIKESIKDTPQLTEYTITDTPFKFATSSLTIRFYKEKIAGSCTKWLLIVEGCSTTQEYKAYKTSDTSYIYSTYSMGTKDYPSPWEIWLPSDLTAESVSLG